MVLLTAKGKSVAIPGDFACQCGNADYRPAFEAIAALGRQSIGERNRTFRESARLIQEALARAADIGRATLVRFENGERYPRFKTLKSVASALRVEASYLQVEPESLPR